MVVAGVPVVVVVVVVVVAVAAAKHPYSIRLQVGSFTYNILEFNPKAS